MQSKTFLKRFGSIGPTSVGKGKSVSASLVDYPVYWRCYNMMNNQYYVHNMNNKF